MLERFEKKTEKGKPMKKHLTPTNTVKAVMALLLLISGLAIGGCQREAGATPVDSSQPTPPRQGSGAY
ncbi:MAG: hypothetical protein MPJ78_19130 [Hyphomicrobiaceae bacterium]|nr:hypothetical protein [Hyphomicrobiaceae bacterium]